MPKMQLMQLKIEPEVLKALKKKAADKEWSLAHYVRKLCHKDVKKK